MPTKISWLNISVLLLHNFIKESKTWASYFPSVLLCFDELVCVRKRKFIVREISLFMWTADLSGTTLSFQGSLKMQREHHLKILFRLFKVIMRAKCVLIMLEWHCSQRFVKITGKEKCGQTTSPTQPQNWSFHVVNWKRTAHKMY